MNSLCTIYGLSDPRDSSIRYIGRTKFHLKKRLSKHLGSSDKTHRSFWIKSLLKEGIRPDIFEIEVVPLEEHREAERFWIRYFLMIGADLVNCKEGGEGSVLGNKTTFRRGHVMTEEVRGKISCKMRGTSRPSPSKETREKMAEAKKGKKRGPHPDHVKERMRKSQIGKKHGPLTVNHRRLLSEIRRGRPWSENRRAAFERGYK